MKVCWGVFGVLVGLFVVAVTPLGVLLILAAVTRIRMLLKSFLLGTGASAVGWPVSLYLHGVLIRFFPTEPFTYILFFFVFMSAFIIGAVGTILIGVRQKLSSH